MLSTAGGEDDNHDFSTYDNDAFPEEETVAVIGKTTDSRWNILQSSNKVKIFRMTSHFFSFLLKKWKHVRMGHILSLFTFKVLNHSVRASCDPNLQGIQRITRKSYNELQSSYK